MNIISQALEIARADLRACFTREGIAAGKQHFVDLWARDSFFACFGALSLKELAMVRITLQTFLNYQRTDGLLPYRLLRSSINLSKYFGRPKYLTKPAPNYRSFQSGGLVLDSGLLAPVVIENYLVNIEDLVFLKNIYPNLLKSSQWYLDKFPGLLSEFFLCEWADAVLKSGEILYTNVLYYRCLWAMSKLSGKLRKPKLQQFYAEKSRQIKEQINQRFWNGRYFVDWCDYCRQDYFSSHGNLLAIFFDLTTTVQSESIIDYLEKNCLAEFTVKSNYPKYPLWRIPLQNYLTGTSDYHNGCLWLQPGLMYVLSLIKMKRITQARSFLAKIANQIVKYQGVYEVYESSGEPVKRLFYQAEQPFAWSAGLFIYACARNKFLI
jgi:glycogen debranching enzyme